MNIKKPLIIIIGLLLVSTTIAVGVNLPNGPVTLKAVYNTNSYFTITLSNVPAGYDVTNGPYPGWCLDYTKNMPRNVDFSVRLYNYNSSNLPTAFQDDDWDKVIWILNNKDSYTRWDIQYAIWYYINELPWNNVDPETNARDLIENANISGEGYQPESGDIIPIIAVPERTDVQCTFFEVVLPPTGHEGLTPGFWKNHLSAWYVYDNQDEVGDVFTIPNAFNALSDDTLLEALQYKGGNTDIDAARILLRAAVAALLNAAHPDIDYPLTQNAIIQEVNTALTHGRSAMLDLKDTLDGYNNLGADL